MTTKKTAAKTTTKKKTATKKTAAKKTAVKAIKPISREEITLIFGKLGLDNFSRPYAGLIDKGDFGPVATYIPIFKEEYEKLSADLKKKLYDLGESKYGLITFLPRTFEAADGGKAVKITKYLNASGDIIKIKYETDKKGVFETEHPLRHLKLLTYAKNKKLPEEVVKSK